MVLEGKVTSGCWAPETIQEEITSARAYEAREWHQGDGIVACRFCDRPSA